MTEPIHHNLLWKPEAPPCSADTGEVSTGEPEGIFTDLHLLDHLAQPVGLLSDRLLAQKVPIDLLQEGGNLTLLQEE